MEAFVTAFWPFTITGDCVALLQFAEAALVAHCSLNPIAFVGQLSTKFVPVLATVSNGAPVVKKVRLEYRLHPLRLSRYRTCH
jgi:hypothetical protein